MNNDLMLAPRELLQAVATGDFREQGIALASLRRMLAESPAAQAVDEDKLRDDAKLISSINSLLALDAKGALSPHGIGGLARELLEKCSARLARAALAAPVRAVRMPDVDALAEIIRRVDGSHSLGAGALAEKILDAVSQLNQSPNQKEITE